MAALRRLLKAALRQHGFRCVSARELKTPAQRGQDAQHATISPTPVRVPRLRRKRDLPHYNRLSFEEKRSYVRERDRPTPPMARCECGVSVPIEEMDAHRADPVRCAMAGER